MRALAVVGGKSVALCTVGEEQRPARVLEALGHRNTVIRPHLFADYALNAYLGSCIIGIESNTEILAYSSCFNGADRGYGSAVYGYARLSLTAVPGSYNGSCITAEDDNACIALRSLAA